MIRGRKEARNYGYIERSGEIGVILVINSWILIRKAADWSRGVGQRQGGVTNGRGGD